MAVAVGLGSSVFVAVGDVQFSRSSHSVAGEAWWVSSGGNKAGRPPSQAAESMATLATSPAILESSIGMGSLRLPRGREAGVTCAWPPRELYGRLRPKQRGDVEREAGEDDAVDHAGVIGAEGHEFTVDKLPPVDAAILLPGDVLPYADPPVEVLLAVKVVAFRRVGDLGNEVWGGDEPSFGVELSGAAVIAVPIKEDVGLGFRFAGCAGIGGEANRRIVSADDASGSVAVVPKDVRSIRSVVRHDCGCGPVKPRRPPRR